MPRSLLIIALALSASPASAQVFGAIQREPTWWFGAGVGAFNANEVADGGTGSVWDFGSRTSAQYRASLEKAIRNQSAIGILGTYVRAPIQYRGQALPSSSCVACDAHVDVYSLFAMFHAGGGPGFHQVIEAGVGATSYQNFKRDSDGAELEPKKAERDFSFVFGYGFGYTINPRFHVNLVQEYGLAIHESEGTASGASNTLRPYVTRLYVRFGLGGGAARRRFR